MGRETCPDKGREAPLRSLGRRIRSKLRSTIVSAPSLQVSGKGLPVWGNCRDSSTKSQTEKKKQAIVCLSFELLCSQHSPGWRYGKSPMGPPRTGVTIGTGFKEKTHRRRRGLRTIHLNHPRLRSYGKCRKGTPKEKCKTRTLCRTW